jgi:predicted hotdog family 3-hydroxylacyl-ACP dehydratase
VSEAFPPVADLVRHRRGLLLIDAVLAEDEAHIRTEATVREGPFAVAGRGVPGYLGFEYMAQTISAKDGLERRRQGEAPQLGFLLGSRRYQCKAAWFEAGERLEIVARPVLNEGELRAFDCVLTGRGGAELASALVNVYRPHDPDGFVARS